MTMTKSYATVETKQCPVCGELHDSGAVLLDTKLRERFERETCTGFALCPTHQNIINDGYIVLVGADEPARKGKVKLEQANLTGEAVFVRKEVAEQMFDLPEHMELESIMLADPAVIKILMHMQSTASPSDTVH